MIKKTTDKNFVDELFFGVRDFNEVSISHQINVKEIIYPEDMDSLKPLEIREQSKRGGILIRNIRVDGLNKISETKFIS